MITIGFVGTISTGKSSVVNAALRRMAAPVSMKRTTRQPIMYTPRNLLGGKEIPAAEIDKLVHGKVTDAIVEKLTKPVVQIMRDLPYTVIDFPGFNDSADAGADDIHLKIFERVASLLDIIVFVSTSERVFIQADELKTFKRVEDICTANCRKGRLQRLITVANRYDFPDDEHDEVIAAARKLVNGPIFAVSAWKLFLQRGDGHPHSGADWIKRELKKMERVRGCPISEDEIAYLRVIMDSGAILIRRAMLLTHIRSFAHIDVPIADWSRYIIAFGEPADAVQLYLGALAERLRDESAVLQFLYMNYIASRNDIPPTHILVMIKPSILKCFYYAAENDVYSLARYLMEPWTIGGTVKVPQGLANELFTNGVEVNVAASTINLAAVTKIITGSDNTVTSNTIIGMIKDPKWRAYFGLTTRKYGEVIAKIVAGSDSVIAETISAVGVNYAEFKERIATDFFTNGATSVISRVICELALDLTVVGEIN